MFNLIHGKKNVLISNSSLIYILYLISYIVYITTVPLTFPLRVFETSEVCQYRETPSRNSSISPSFHPNYGTRVSKIRALVFRISYTSCPSVSSTTSSQSPFSHLHGVSSLLSVSQEAKLFFLSLIPHPHQSVSIQNPTSS